MTLLVDLWLTSPILSMGSLLALAYLEFHLLKRATQMRRLGITPQIKQPFYILNPRQRSIAKEDRFLLRENWQALAFRLLIAGLCSLLYSMNRQDFQLLVRLLCELTMGVVIGLFIHSNLQAYKLYRAFKLLITHPEEITGELSLSTSLVFTNGRRILGENIVTWTVFFLLIGSPFFLGGALGLTYVLLKTYPWEKQRLRDDLQG